MIKTALLVIILSSLTHNSNVFSISYGNTAPCFLGLV